MERTHSGGFQFVLRDCLDGPRLEQADIAGIFDQLWLGTVEIVTLADGWLNSLHAGSECASSEDADIRNVTVGNQASCGVLILKAIVALDAAKKVERPGAHR